MINSLRGLLLFGALYCATQGALDSWDEAYELPYLSYNCLTVAAIALCVFAAPRSGTSWWSPAASPYDPALH